MKIENYTRINTRQLAALIRAVADVEKLEPGFVGNLRVEVKHRKRTHARADDQPSGYAYYHSTYFCLAFVEGVVPDRIATAKVIAHELAHCQGVRHRNLNNPRYGWKDGWREVWSWAIAYPLELRAEKAPPTKADKTMAEIERCMASVKLWRSRAKAAATKIRKWTARLRYYEKAAMSLQGTGEGQ